MEEHQTQTQSAFGDKHHRVAVYKTKEMHTIKIINELTRLKVCPEGGKMDRDTSLAIWVSKTGDREFMEKTKDLAFPEMRSLSFVKMGSANKLSTVKLINRFMSHCFTRPIRYLQLDSHTFSDIANFNIGIRPLLSLTTQQVLIKNFLIEGMSLKDIFES